MRSIVMTAALLVAVTLLLFGPALAVSPAEVLESVLPAVPSRTDTVERPRVAVPEFPWSAGAAALLAQSRWSEAGLLLENDAGRVGRAERLLYRFARGLAATRAAQWELAEAELEPLLDGEASVQAFPLAALAAEALAEVQSALGRTHAAASRQAEAVRLAPPALAATSRVAWARTLVADGQTAAARDALAPVLALPSDNGSVPAALELGAMLDEDAGEHVVARRLRERLYFEHAATKEGSSVSLRPDFAGACEAAIGAGRSTLVLDRAEALIAARRGRDVTADLERVVALEKGARIRDRAEFLLGRALRQAGNSKKALEHFRKVGTGDPVLATRAALGAGQAAAKLGMRGEKDRDRALRRAVAGPACAARDEACLLLAELRVKDEDIEDARELWEKVASEGVEADVRAKAGWRRAWSSYVEEDEDQALAAFRDLVDAAPRSREAAAALYWSGRILRDRNEGAAAGECFARARQDFPNDYYGMLSAEELGGELMPAGDAGLDDAHAALELSLGQVSLRDAAAARRIAALSGLGFVADALKELSLIEKQARAAGDAGAAEGAGLAQVLLLARASRHDEALRALRRAAPDWRLRRDLPLSAWCAAYPMAHAGLVLSEAERSELDPALVFALIHQESVFRDSAISHAGARGLMQVMPATGRTIAHWLGDPPRGVDLLDADVNVRYGTVYLRRLLDEFGEPELALAGYNAGGGRVRRWWRALPREDVPYFVESIPFDETRDYVKAVTWNRMFYARAYAGALGARADAPVLARIQGAAPEVKR